MTADSTRKTQPKKPHRDFPLFPHQRGYWVKKVRGKLHYFGKIANDPSGQAALRLWREQRDDLLAGRTPRSTPADGLTIAVLCSHFLTAKEHRRDAGEIRPRTFDEYFANCKFVVLSFGKNRLVDDLAAEDFQALRAQFSKSFGVHKLAKEVQLTRSIFKFGVDAGLIEKQVRFGPTFKKPPARLMRAHKQKSGSRMFEAPALRCIIAHADQPLQAMVLLTGRSSATAALVGRNLSASITRPMCSSAMPDVWQNMLAESFAVPFSSERICSYRAGRVAMVDRELSPGRHRVAAIRAADALKILVDVQQIVEEGGFPPAHFSPSSRQPLQIGFRLNDYFRGRIRDVRIYRRA